MALFLLLVLFLQTLVLKAELVQVIQLARHGARTPNSWQPILNQYKEGNGELTSLGHVQQYFLGKEMRRRYIEETNFLSPVFNASEIVIKSSYKNRTQRSAYAFTSGLYPQEDGVWIENEYGKEFPAEKLLPLKNWKTVQREEIDRIKIHEDWAKQLIEVIAIEEDYHFHAHENDVCPPAEKMVKDRKKSKIMLELEDFFKQNLYEELIKGVNTFLNDDKHLDLSMLNLKKAKSILDNYRCNSFHGLPHTPFEENIVKLLYKVRYSWAYDLLQKDTMLKAVQASKLLSEFLDYTKSAKEKAHNAPKYVFYSAHDTNLENLFSVFLHEDDILLNDHYNIIPFSSVLSIEVHRETDKDGKEVHKVKLLFNDEPQFIRWCRDYECDLDRFHKILTHHMIPDLEGFCSVGKAPKQAPCAAGVVDCVVDEVEMKASEKLGKVKIED